MYSIILKLVPLDKGFDLKQKCDTCTILEMMFCTFLCKMRMIAQIVFELQSIEPCVKRSFLYVFRIKKIEHLENQESEENNTLYLLSMDKV